jgi:TetR/AcrR family tetracycline transcriptional repressor
VGVTREDLVQVGLEVVAESGLEGLTMRSLASRLGVKAASLYWHVRDRDELVGWLADALLAEVAMPENGPWRARTLAVAAAIDEVLRRRRGADQVLLASTERLRESRPSTAIRGDLERAGLAAAAAAGVASMIMEHAILAPRRPDGGTAPTTTASGSGAPELGDRFDGASRRRADLTIENLSRGIQIVAVRGLDRLAIPVVGPGTSASVAVTGDQVVVRRLRGAGTAQVLIDATVCWAVRVKGPVLRIRLELAEGALEQLRVNGGARDLEVVLPEPAAEPTRVEISGGASQIRLRRTPSTAASVVAHAGALAVRLDGDSMAAVLNDWSWSAEGASGSGHLELDISGGAADVRLDSSAPDPQPAQFMPGAPSAAEHDITVEIELLLDGVERRLEAGRGSPRAL